MVSSIILIVVPCVLVIIGMKLLFDIKKISNQGIQVQGIVFDIKHETASNSGISYPIVRFLTSDDTWITQTSKIGLIPGIYKKGKEITIIYQSNNPNNFFIKDKFTYSIPVIMIIIGSLLFLFGIFQLVGILSLGSSALNQ